MSDPILAYIDPGSGSLIIQFVIASIIAVPVIFRARVTRLIGVFRRSKGSAPGPDDAPPAG